MTDPKDPWNSLLDLFHAAADRPDNERAAYLRRQGASEDTVDEVLELLERHKRETGRIDHAPKLPDLDGPPGERPLIPGLELLDELGTGGMGTVYRARRTEDFLPDVAVKVIRAGLDGPEILHRFEDERRILAALDHPNICRLIDGGLTADGRPYFVTELVHEALPLHEYCAHHDLDLRSTLELFADACRAVQHAHSRLIVHRDIKPSNLLVSSGGQDSKAQGGRSFASKGPASRGTVKLADFGIAKVIAGPDADDDEATRTELRRLTPEYAAPEQIRGEAISTGVDVYSLGVTLYRLLTGTLPHAREGRSAAELAHAICTEAPSRPSTRITGATSSSDWDDTRGPAPSTAPGSVARADRRALRGDLDNIVLAALRKDPSRRTPSVLALLEDIEAHLDGRPVRARPPTVSYLLGKFVRRHPVGTTLAGAALALLVASGVLIVRQGQIATAERDRARVEAQRAQRVTEAMAQLFEIGDPRRNSEVAEMTLADFTDLAATNALEGLDGDPVTRALVALSLGRWQVAMYRYPEAAALLEGAIPALREATDSENELAEALHWSAAAHENQGSTDVALERIDEAIQIRRAIHGHYHPAVAESLDRKGRILGTRTEFQEAADTLRNALAVHRSAEGPATAEQADTLAMLGLIQYRLADYEGAVESVQEALGIYRATVGADDWRVGRDSGNLGAILFALSEFPAALAAQQEALRVRSALFGPNHPEVALTVSMIGNLEYLLGDHEQAIDTIERSRRLRVGRFGEGHPSVALSDLFLGEALMVTGRFDRARAALENARRIQEQALPKGHPRIANVLGKLGALEQFAGQPERSLQLLREAIDQHLEVHGKGDIRLATNRTRLGRALLDLGRIEEARAEAAAALTAYAELGVADGLFAAETNLLMGDLQQLDGSLHEARTSFDQALAIVRSSLPPEHWRILDAEARLTALEFAASPDDVVLRDRLRIAAERLGDATFPRHPSVRRLRDLLGSAG